jgi:hypothetical protein
MKAFALAVVATAGLLCSAGTADAQYRSRGSYGRSYAVPTYSYSYPTYSYATPSYYSPVVTAGYATPYVSGYTPGTMIYSGGSYYDTNVWSTPTYGSYYNSYPTYYGSGYNSYYGSGYNSGVNITPSGVNVGGRRIWRW